MVSKHRTTVDNPGAKLQELSDQYQEKINDRNLGGQLSIIALIKYFPDCERDLLQRLIFLRLYNDHG